ncbi:hypothetical protein [Salinimicrobium sp. WS361]|uniref:hypothetical protein n=1 Tax=Salinimicrobium sp. WS361 TaxID=3425123 RepID=UPI003D6EDA4B
MSLNFNIELKQDDPQRVIELNGVPTRFYATAEEFNLLVMVINHLLGKESALYKGEFDFIEELEEEHPLPEPGSYAHLRVVDGDDIFCRWDNTNKKWIQDGLVKDQPEVNVGVAENIRAVLEATGTKYYGTKDGVAGVWAFPQGTGGGTPETFNGFIVNNFTNGYQGGLTWKPFSNFEFGGNSFSATATLTPTTADIPAGEKKFAAIVLNSNGTITLAQGQPAVNPSAPNIDTATQLIPDGGLILLSSGAATPEGVTLQKIYTNNSGIVGGEADATIIRGGVRWNLTSNEGEDGVCIKGTNLLADDLLHFTPEAAIPIGNFTELTFKIKNLVDTGLPAGSSGGFRFFLTGSVLVNGNVQTTTILLPQFQNFGYDVTNTTDWQFISIKIPAVSLIDVTGVSFLFDHGDPAVVPTILLDEIKYNDGSAPAAENFATVGFVERVIAELKAYSENTFADRSLSNLFNNLTEAQKTAIKDKLGITEVDGVTEAELNAALLALENDLLLQIDAVEEDVLVHENRLTALESVGGVVPIAANTVLSRAAHHKKKLFVTANVTITYPAAGLGGDFECNTATSEAGQVQFIDEAATPGDDLDAPDGTLLEARKMAHLFERPDDGRLSIYGDVTA